MAVSAESHRRVNVYIDGYNFYLALSKRDNAKDYELAWCNFLRLSERAVDSLSVSNPAFAGAVLGAVKYFTATIPENMPSNPSGLQRKHDWLDALHHETGGRVEVIHGTFKARSHRFYIEADQLDNLEQSGIRIDRKSIQEGRRTYAPRLTIHEEKQTDVMLATALVTDAALGRFVGTGPEVIQRAPEHRSNRRPTPSPCQAAVVISEDIDFVPAAEVAAQIFRCPVAIGFVYPHRGYRLERVAQRREDLFVHRVSEEELRACMLPALVVLGEGRTIRLDTFTRSHFQK